MRANVVLVLAAATIVIALAGCASKSMSGVVGLTSQTRMDSYAADIGFTSGQGKETTLHKERKPFAILAFTSHPSEACCSVRPEIISLADRFRTKLVTVVQLSLPTSECPHGPGCLEVCDLEKPNVISLCDAKRTAWNLYGQPESDSVFLIDENNKIIDTGRLPEIESLASRAATLSYHLDEYLYGNVGGDS